MQWIRTSEGAALPLSQVAELHFTKSLRQIKHKNRQRIYTLSPSIDKRYANAEQVVRDFKKRFLRDLQLTYPELHIFYGGAEEERSRFMDEITYYSSIAIIVICILMAI